MGEAAEQVRVGWEQAPGEILALAERVRAPDRPTVVVGVTGPVGSGKSTLAARIGGVCMPTDHYLPDYASIPEDERDEPRHAALGLLADHLATLRRGKAVHAPVWSFHAHAPAGRTRVEPGPVIVCEGLFALHEEVRGLVDIGVYIEAPRGVRRSRWAALERSGARGWGVERAMAYFERVAEPTFERFAADYRAWARVLVSNAAGTPEERDA